MIFRALVFALMTAFLPATASAATFQFSEQGTGDTLATLELSGSAPYDLTSIVDFSFTSQGSAIFGFPVGSFAFPFVQLLNGTPFTDQNDPSGGLSGDGGFAEFATAFTDLGIGGGDPDSLSIYFSGAVANPDYILMFSDFNSSRTIRFGDWVPAPTAIPLPAGGLLLLSGLAGLLVAQRRGKA